MEKYSLDYCMGTLGSSKYVDQLQTHPESISAYFKKNDPQLSMLLEETDIIYDPIYSIPLICGLSVISSSRFCPKVARDEMKNPLTFSIASANGAFRLYESQDGSYMFMKVGLESSDHMEIETLSQKVLGNYAPPHQQKYILPFMASGNVIVTKTSMDRDFVSFHIGKYKSSAHDENYFGESFINQPNAIIAPALWTRIVPSGMSLHEIIQAIGKMHHPTDRHVPLHKRNMHWFLRSNMFEKIYDKPNGMPAVRQVIDKIRSNLFRLLNDFIANVISVCVPMKFSHSDLHGGNILYDAIADNFVMVDYGRCVFDLNSVGFDVSDVMIEYTKIRSKVSLSQKSIAADPNAFFKEFKNNGMRVDLQDTKVAAYGILLDLAPMVFRTIYQVHSRLEVPESPIVGMMVDNTITVASIDEIKAYIAIASLTACDLMLAYFALILRAAASTGLFAFTSLGANPNEDAFTVEYDDLFAIDPRSAVFYIAGQPHQEAYDKYKTALNSLASDVGFYKVIFDKFVFPKKKGIELKPDQTTPLTRSTALDMTNTTTAANAANVNNRNSQDSRDSRDSQSGGNHRRLDKVELTRLTYLNYEYNAALRSEMTIANKYYCNSYDKYRKIRDYAHIISKERALDLQNSIPTYYDPKK